MLVKLSGKFGACHEKIKINKYVNGENASLRGAFSSDSEIVLSIENRRAFGIGDAALFIEKDGEGERRISFEVGERGELSANIGSLTEGLYWYRIEFTRGWDILHTDSINNVDFNLSQSVGRKFRLLIYEKGFKTPDWFKGGVMYQIFVDRFSKSGKSPLRSDAQNESDWYAPISQFADIWTASAPPR